MTSSTITTTAAAIMAPSLRSPLALSLTLLGLVALCQGSSTHNYKCYSFDTTGKGAIKPKGDIVVEVGSSYEAYCLFNPEEVQVGDVYFETTGDDARRIPHTVVNSSAIKVQVEHTEPTKYDLRCLMGAGRFICQRSVFVGYEPQDVKNFSCLSKNFLSLNCTWEEPENPVKVSYTLTYVLPGYLDSSRCPKAGKNWCSWEGAQFHSVRQDWLMTFTATNQLIKEKNKKPVEFKHEVNLYATVIPDPAINFEAEVLGPHEVKLEWALPYPINVFAHGNVTHELRYRMVPFRSMYEDRHWVEVATWEESPPQFNPESYTKVISNLQPYVEYEFSIRLHTGSGPVRKEMWSKPVLKRIRTEASRPAIAPLTTLGMFEVEETKLHRDIYVSWQTVDPLYENGPDFAYEVKMYNRHEGSHFSSLSTKNGFAKFSRLDNNIEYRFEIRPRNGEGLPEDPSVRSEVIVPKKAALLSTPSYFKVIAYPGSNTTTYMVRWRLPEHHHADHNIETVTLYWCKQTEYENRCQNKIEWEISDEPNNFVKNLTGYDTTSRYMFGISVNSHNSSSGIKWSACIARHGVQQPALQRFYHTYVSSTEVKLKWELDCKAEAAQPNAFNISYCIVEENGKNCSEPEKYVRVDGESTVEYVVNNLHPYRHYIFSIATISDLGLGKWTPSILVTTKPSMPSGPPLNIREISTSQTSISIAWDPPDKSKQNGEIIEYSITIKNGDNRSFTQRRNVTTFTTTELDPYTNYSFEVVPCTRVDGGKACGTDAAYINAKTKIGAPGKIDLFQYNSPWLSWEHDKCNGPSCSYELQYTVNDTTFWYTTSLEQTSVSLEDLNISCPVKQGEIPVSLRAVNTDEDGHRLSGPSWDMKVTCPSKGLALWIILAIAVMSIILSLIVFILFTYGREQIKTFFDNLRRNLSLPNGLDPQLQSPSCKNTGLKPEREKFSPSTLSLKPSEEQDLIKHGSERQHRNLSGDSGTSVADQADSSGCSTGGDSVSSSGSDRIPQSSDSGTVQEEAGFPSEEKKWVGAVRLRTPAPPYVCQGPPEKAPSMKGYVSLGSVPNLTGTATDGMPPMQQSNPNLGLETLQEVRMGGRRTSTGYISMPTNESDGMSFQMDDLDKLVLPHERRPGDYIAYSRHYIPYKKISDFSPYTKAQSLPWLNTGYVAVAQAEDGGQSVSGAQEYVTVGDAMNAMKRQPSLPSLSRDISKTLITPDKDLPPGAYCKLGARGSPDPLPNSHGYVSETHHMPVPSSLAFSPPVCKSPYVTCAMAESIASPKKEPLKATNDNVSVGDITDGQWAYPIMHPITPEETREVLSAPVEGTRSRTIQPTRPNSSETNHNRSQFPPTGHSLSKQSSGYASANVSLTFQDPLVMSPKKLLARSQEPHSVVYSPNHKPSMV